MPACIDWGLSAEEGAAALSAVGLCGAVGRVGLGFAADRLRVSKVALLAGCMAVAGVPIVGLALAGGGSPGVVIAACGFFGVFSGSVVAQVPPLLASLMGQENLPLALGSQYSVQVPLVLALPPIVGWLRQEQGNFGLGLALCGAAFILAPRPLLPLRRRE